MSKIQEIYKDIRSSDMLDEYDRWDDEIIEIVTQNPEKIEEVIQIFHEEDDDYFKQMLAWILGRLKCKEPISYLCNLLNDPDEFKQYKASIGLIWLEDELGAEAMLRLAKNSRVIPPHWPLGDLEWINSNLARSLKPVIHQISCNLAIINKLSNLYTIFFEYKIHGKCEASEGWDETIFKRASTKKSALNDLADLFDYEKNTALKLDLALILARLKSTVPLRFLNETLNNADNDRAYKAALVLVALNKPAGATAIKSLIDTQVVQLRRLRDDLAKIDSPLARELEGVFC